MGAVADDLLAAVDEPWPVVYVAPTPYGVPQRRARHRRHVPVEERQRPAGVALAGLADPSADRLLDQVVVGVDEELASANVSSRSPRRMKNQVLTIAVRRSHTLADRASAYRTSRGLSTR
jgi:hypothetical protein